MQLLIKYNSMPAFVEVTPEQQKIIDLTTDLGAEIPMIGPFLSPLSILFFGEKKDPSYEDMKNEWEGYTNQRIEEDRKIILNEHLDGYYRRVKEINYVAKDDLELQGTRWESLQSTILGEIGDFQSQPKEPAAPLLFNFSIVAHLRIDALNRLMQIYTIHEPELHRDKTYFKDLVDSKKEYNKLIEIEIQKTGEERASQVTQVFSRNTPFGGYIAYEVVPHSDPKKMRPVSRQYSDSQKRDFWTCAVFDGKTQIAKLKGPNCQAEATSHRVHMAETFKKKKIENCRRLFIIPLSPKEIEEESKRIKEEIKVAGQWINGAANDTKKGFEEIVDKIKKQWPF